MKAYNIQVLFNPLEFISIAAMCHAANSWGEDRHTDPLYTAFIKMSDACWPLLTKREKNLLTKNLKAMKKVFGNPSIGRGMMMGGMESLLDDLDSEMNNRDLDNG